MIGKKERETRFINGTAIHNIKGEEFWVSCTLEDGSKMSISATVLFKLFDNFKFKAIKHGDKWRVTSFSGLED